MLVLGIDPGSIVTGWAILESKGNKVTYVNSGILKFDNKVQFLPRLAQVQQQMLSLLNNYSPDYIALESLIYVKSPTALSKLAQTRGVIISTFIQDFQNRVFEYSPNLVKSTAVGHGHADKASIQKFLHKVVGKREYQTHDESDAVAIALCHILNQDKKGVQSISTNRRVSSGGLAASLAHRIKR